MKVPTYAFRFLLIGFSLFLMIGCSETNTDDLILGDFAYPLQAGQTWRYLGQYYNFNIRPESLAVSQAISVSYVSVVEVMEKIDLLDTLEVYPFKETVVMNGSETTHSWDYFNNRANGLFSYAYTTSNAQVMPRKLAPGAVQLRFHGRSFADAYELIHSLDYPFERPVAATDSITIEDPPFCSLKYPLTRGSEWPTTDPPGIHTMSKKVIEGVTVEVPAGSFLCARIQWLFDINDDGIWDPDIEAYDYISKNGLVKRTRIFRDATLTSYEYPLGIGLEDVASVWELQSMVTPATE